MTLRHSLGFEKLCFDGPGEHDTPQAAASQLHRASHGLPTGRPRGGLLVTIGLPLLTWLLVAGPPAVNLSTDLLLYLLAIVIIAVVGGATASALGTVTADILTAGWLLPGDDSLAADVEKLALARGHQQPDALTRGSV